jgi:proteasome accessory factor B
VTKKTDQKLQRWIDLLAALLRHHYGLTFERLKTEVPTYAASTDAAALARMFERDKDELRAFGIPITTSEPNDDEPQRYFIDRREMYLPYLTLASMAPGTSRASQGSRSSLAVHDSPPQKRREGYRSLPELAFEPDELRALVLGAREVSRIGDAAMAADAESALRKLAYDLDLPVGSVLGENGGGVVVPREPATIARIRVLGEAVLRLKRVTFRYRSMANDTAAERTVEPYGLFFVSGHWYLAARDIHKDDVRNFRVSRMDYVEMNEKKPQSADFQVPSSFRLAEHARARGPWELGEGDGEEMIVHFRGDSGVTVAAEKLGVVSSLGDRHRAFQVKRLDSFVRWLLSFAGEVVPVSPQRLVDEYRETARATFAAYSVES